MRRIVTVLSGLVIAAAGMTAVASPAGAAPTAAEIAIDAKLDDVVARTPGARRIDAYSVDMTQGVVLTMPKPGENARAAVANCAYKYLCVWSEYGFVGPRLTWTECGHGVINIGNKAFPGGGLWRDKISSVMNNQTSGTWSTFYDWYIGGGWDYLKGLKAYGYWRDLAYDTADDGSHMNDRIDGVFVC